VSSPAPKAEAGEGNADLRNGEQFRRLRQKREGRPGAGVPLFGKMAQARIAHRKQRHFRSGEKGIDCDNQAEQQQAGSIVGRNSHSPSSVRGFREPA